MDACLAGDPHVHPRRPDLITILSFGWQCNSPQQLGLRPPLIRHAYFVPLWSCPSASLSFILLKGLVGYAFSAAGNSRGSQYPPT